MRPLALLLLLAAAAAAQAPPDSLDLFVIAGQSNALGAGGSRLEAPVPPRGSAYWAHIQRNGLFRWVEVDATIYLSRSLGPAFAARYVERTGRPVALLQLSVGATANVPAAERGRGHWSAREPGPGPSGGPNRLLEALAHLDEVLEKLPPGTALRPAGVIWSQGEQDALMIDEGAITGDDYRAEMEATLTRLRAALGERFGRGPAPLYLVQTGHRSRGDTGGHRAVRAAQRAGAEAGLYTLACDHAEAFPELGMLVDDVHWDQDALNHVGGHVADVVADAATDVSAGGDPSPAPARPFPNPARPGALVRGLEPGTRVFDVLGRHVATSDLEGMLPAPRAAGAYLAGGVVLVVR